MLIMVVVVVVVVDEDGRDDEYDNDMLMMISLKRGSLVSLGEVLLGLVCFRCLVEGSCSENVSYFVLSH